MEPKDADAAEPTVVPAYIFPGGGPVEVLYAIAGLSTVVAEDDPDIIPAREPLEGEAYRAAVRSLHGVWDGDLFEPLDPPLDELGDLFG